MPAVALLARCGAVRRLDGVGSGEYPRVQS
jgi:hypothetical protein